MTRPRALSRRHVRRQTGEVLILTLLVLLVLYLGFLYTMRNVMSEAQLAGNNLARQKTAQASDVALDQLVATIFSTYGGQRLDTGPAATQPWFRAVDPGVAGPTSAYWAIGTPNSCLGNADSTLRCGAVPVTVGANTLPYSAYAVVQYTGRSDPTACPSASYQALYYDVFLYVVENTNATGVQTETVIKVCTPYSPTS